MEWDLDQDQQAKAVARDRLSEHLVAWRALAFSKRAEMCGVPFGGPRRWSPAGGVYAREYTGGSGCADPCCPRCGMKDAAFRWACTTITLSEHLAEGGQAMFLSVAGSHRRDEPVEAAAGRILAMAKRIPGVGGVRRVLEGAGMIGYVRRIECTFGGINGPHPNMHMLIFLTGSLEDPDERAARIARLVEGELHRQAARDEGLAELLRSFSVREAFDGRAAGVGAADYITKIDGPGIGGTAFELTDPSGSKASHGNVGDRAVAGWVAAVARAHGYGPRRFSRAIKTVPELIALRADVAQWEEATRRRHLWITSHGLFARLEHVPLDELFAKASELAGVDDLAGLRIACGLDRAPAPPPPAASEEVEPCPFAPAAPEEPPPRPPFWSADVWIDPGLEVEWVESDDGPGMDTVGGIDGAVSRLLDRLGPWGGAHTIGMAVLRQTGEAVYCYARRADTGELEVVYVSRDNDVHQVGDWEPLGWSDVDVHARASPKFTYPARS